MPAIIIWWSPRSWKTSLWFLFKKHGWEHIEFDLFKYFLKWTVKDSPSLNDLWFYGSWSLWDEKESAEEIFDHYLKTMKVMEWGFNGVFEKINMKENIFIECTYTSPKQLFELREKWHNIHVFCTGIDYYNDAKKCIMEWLKNNPNDWIHTIWKKHVEKAIKFVVIFSQYIKKECSKYDIEYINYQIPRDIWLQKVYGEMIQ